jgi:CHAD domain-containing protein
MQDIPSFREYGIKVIGDRLKAMLSHAEGVRLAEDIEALHQMRVGSRRLRAALGMFAPAFPEEEFAEFESEVKAITDALGAARDLDVMIETLTELEHELPSDERSGMDRFIEMKRVERARAQREVIRALNRLERANLPEKFERLVQSARAARREDAADDLADQPLE